MRNAFLRSAWIALLVVLVLLVSGCSKGTPPAASGAGAGQKGEAASEAAKTFVAKLGTVEPVGGHRAQELERFAAAVADATQGKVKIEVYPGEQLGTAREMIEATQMGSIQAVMVPADNFTGFAPAMAIPGLPYLFPSREVTYQVLMHSEVGKAMLATLEKKGLKGIAFWESGFKQLTGNFPIRTPDDLKGKKIRVMENPVLVAEYQALGATAVPINFGELYNALQQGVVDGQENPLATIYDRKFYEVQKYLALTDHSFLALALVFNKAWFDSLPAEFQKAIEEAAQASGEHLIELQAKMEKETIIPTVEKAGVKVLTMSPEARQAFAAKAGPAAKAKLVEMLDDEGKQLLAQVEAKIAELTKK